MILIFDHHTALFLCLCSMFPTPVMLVAHSPHMATSPLPSPDPKLIIGAVFIMEVVLSLQTYLKLHLIHEGLFNYFSLYLLVLFLGIF